MSRRWNWDFEDDDRASRKAAKPSAPARPRATDPEGTDPRFRRRRLGAAAVVTLIVVVLVIVLASSHRQGAVSSASTRADARRAAAAVMPSPDTLQAQDKAVSAVLAYTPFVREGGGRSRDVALTFDDGPGPYTPGVLDVLERAHAPATFFAIGRMERYFGASTEREIHDGFAIGDHTEDHPELARLSAHEQYEQLFEQIARVELLGGQRPRLFRPPYGSFNATTFEQLRKLKLLMVLWSVDTDDYEQPGVSVIVERVIAGAHPGAIFLMHDGGGDRSQTIAALPTIIHELRARGYHLVTVERMMLDDPPPRGQPLPTSLSGD